MIITVDAGILLATILTETYTAQAKQAIGDWLSQSVRLIAPDLLQYELVSTIRKAVFQERLDEEQAQAAAQTLLSYPITLYRDDSLLERGLELAHLYNRPRAYDTQYLAVAERYNCDFWTVDERLYNTLSAHLTWVHWIGNYSSPTS